MLNILRQLILIWLASCLLVSSAQAVTDTVRLERQLAYIKTLQANFSQTVTNHERATQLSQGSLTLKRPGKFIWDNHKPYRQLIKANGKTLWILDKDLEQVIIRPISKGIGGTPALLLSGHDRQLAKYYTVKAQNLGQGVVYTLTPKRRGQKGYRYIQLRFDGAQLRGLRFADQLDNITDLRLFKIKMNHVLSDKKFNLRIPMGVDVIRQS